MSDCAGEGGLAHPSVAKCERITTLRRDRLLPRALGGTLSAVRMTEIEKAILRAIGVPVP
jgi:mRNA-degrading endonuclease toxin of MazEF toxin-antitoxin module